jgi:cytochrome c peroxidase
MPPKSPSMHMGPRRHAGRKLSLAAAGSLALAAFTQCQSSQGLGAIGEARNDSDDRSTAPNNLEEHRSDDGGVSGAESASSVPSGASSDTASGTPQSPQQRGNDTSGDQPDPDSTDTRDDEFVFELPAGFPKPAVPANNPMSAAKVELGRHLFYDTRLSGNETLSCASCHRQELAFTDGRALSPGSTGELTPRSSMSLANVVYASTLTWANPLLVALEGQAMVPMFGTSPIELGLTSEEQLRQRLSDDPTYRRLFAAAFPEDEEPFTVRRIAQALASFQRTLISGNSPFDAYLYGKDPNAISPEAIRGYELFNSEKLECFHCHSGFNLSDHTHFEGKPFIERLYHNTGLYNLDGTGAYPQPNIGVMEFTTEPSDMGRFRAPSLRNIAVTAPYMHDGSIATLSEVLDHYAAGGRTIEDGPFAGNGSKNPNKSVLIAGFELTEEERNAVLAFLESLTDTTFLTDPRFSDPWTAED